MPYTPPDSKLIAFSFTGVYTPPDSKLIGIDLIPPPTGSAQVVYPEGFDASAFGTSRVTKPPVLLPEGFTTTVFGTVVLTNRSQGISPDGYHSAAFGTPEKIWNFHSFFRVLNNNPATQWGMTGIHNWKQFVQPYVGDLSRFGVVQCVLQHRTIYPDGSLMAYVGTPAIRSSWQFVTPQGVKYSVITEPKLQLKTRYLPPQGFMATVFGVMRVRYLTTVVAPTGFDSMGISQVAVANRNRSIYPVAVSRTSVLGDPPQVRNRNKVVALTGIESPAFSTFWPSVLNRLRTVWPVSLPLPAVARAVMVRNAAGNINAAGVEMAVFGTNEVDHRHRYRNVSGFNTADYGVPHFTLPQRFIRPSGIYSAFVGGPEITRRQRAVWPISIGVEASDTDPWVSHGIRQVRLLSVSGNAPFGQPSLTRDVQYCVAGNVPAGGFGRPSAILSVRTIMVEGIFFLTPAAAFGDIRTSPRVRSILVQPFSSAVFGTTRIVRNERIISDTGAGKQGGIGEPWISLFRRYVMPRTDWSHTVYGTHHDVWNSRQYITTVNDITQQEIFGTHAIELRNKTLLPRGLDAGKVSPYVLVTNRARLLSPIGQDMSLWGDTLLAPWVRYIYPTTIPSTAVIGFWAVVWNRTRVILPSGIRRPWAGIPRVQRNERIVGTLIGIPPSDAPPSPMISYAIRTIIQYYPATPTMGAPYVGLWRQYVTPTNTDHAVVCPRLYVREFFNVAKPKGREYMRLGVPAVRNGTPELTLGGLAPPRIDGPWVSANPRTIRQGALGYFQPSSVGVTRRERIIYVTGVGPLRFPLTHRVDLDIPIIPPPAILRLIGIPPVPNAVPEPLLRGQVVFIDGWNSATFGAIEVTNMGVWVNSTQSYFLKFGYPETAHRNRIISIDSSEGPKSSPPSNVVIYPLVITIDFEIYPNPLMDKHLAKQDDPLRRPFFGEPTVSNQHRAIQMRGSAFGAQGIPYIHTNYLYAEGWDSNEGRWGLTDFAGPLYIAPYWGRTTEDYIPEVPAYNFDTAKYGTPEVAYPVVPPVWSPYITLSGRDSAVFGNTRVENFNRAVYPTGAAIPGYQVSSPWLHPPFRLLPEGVDMSILSLPMAAYRIRTVYPEGDNFEAVCQEEALTIAARMRVRHGTSRYTAAGWVSTEVGTPMVTPRVRKIYTDGFTNLRVRIAHIDNINTTAQTGWDSQTFGDVSRVEEGKIATGWFASLATGSVRLHRTLPVAAANEPPLADVRVSHAFTPSGFGGLGAGRVAVTNPYGCRDRVIIAGSGTDFSTFGANTHVTQ